MEWIFGVCLICGGVVLIYAYANHQWKLSDRRASEEYWKFKEFMNKMEIDEESVKELTNQIGSISELESINKRLKKCAK